MKRFLRFLPIVALGLFAACGDNPEIQPDPVTYHLEADATDIEVGETVTFTVKTNTGVDVTSQCTICSDVACYSGNTHTFMEAGVFVIQAHFQDNNPENPEGIAAENTVTITVGGADPTAPFRLSADKTEIEVGETVTFTVTSSEGADVTSRCTICSNTACYSGNTHTFSEAGIFVVEAHFQNNDPEHPEGIAAENTVTITVGGGSTTGYTVSADNQAVVKGETITFSMTADDGNDVTADTQFFVRGMKIEGNAFTFNTTGLFAISARYMGDPTQPEGIEASNKLTVNILKEPLTYTLEVDKTESKVREPVVFNVISSEGGSENGKFLIVDENGESYPYHTKMYLEPGTHTLRAVGRDNPELESLNTVTVTISDKSNEVDYSRFYRRSILTELTGTWCGQCPYLAKQLDFVHSELLYDRMVIVAVHDPNTPSQQGMLGDQFGLLFDTYDNIFWGQIPAYTVDFNTNYTTQSWSGNPETNGPKTAEYVESSREFDPLTPGIAVSSTLSGQQLKLTVDITSKETSDYYLGIALVEDGIVGYQNSGGDDYVHNHVGQGMITNVQKLAEPIGSISAGQEKSFSYTYEIPTTSHAHTIDISNCSVAVWVCKASSDSERARFGFLCSNAVSCPVGGSVDYQYEPVE